MRSVAAGDLLPLAGVNSQELQNNLRAADALVTAGRYDEAIAAYEAIRTRIPSLTTINLAIGHAHRMKKDDEKALAAYRALLATDPVNEAARVAISAISLEQGDVKAAEEALTLVAGNVLRGPRRALRHGRRQASAGDASPKPQRGTGRPRTPTRLGSGPSSGSRRSPPRSTIPRVPCRSCRGCVVLVP